MALYNAVLTQQQADEIRHRVAAGERQCDLALEYGATPNTVSKIVRGISYTGKPAKPKTRRSFDPAGRNCTQCKRFKPWSEFSPQSDGLNGHTARCKSCKAADVQQRREVDPVAWQLRQFELGLERKFNVTLEQYNAMGEAQGWVCALCGEPETRLATGKNANGVTIQRLAVDHDHSCCPGNERACGKCVRGLLCAHCNWLVGRLEGPRGRLVVANLPEYLNRRPLAAGVGADSASLERR